MSLRHIRFSRWAVLLVFAMALVAVASTRTAMGAPTAVVAPSRSSPGLGCDPSRPAVAHYSGAVRAPGARASAAVPCMTVAGPSDETAMVGVAASGSLFYAPLIGSPMPGTEGWQP